MVISIVRDEAALSALRRRVRPCLNARVERVAGPDPDEAKKRRRRAAWWRALAATQAFENMRVIAAWNRGR